MNPSMGARTRHPWLVTVFRGSPGRTRTAASKSVPASMQGRPEGGAVAATPVTLAAALALVTLTGCGFHLQGAGELPDDNKRVYIATSDELTPFAVELRRAIERSGGTIASGSAAADLVLRIERDRSGRRVLSVSARNTPQEYEIYYNVEYTVDREGQQVVERQPLELIRNLSFDQTQLLAKDREEAILRDAMARDLAMLVVRRLESLPETATAPATGSAQGDDSSGTKLTPTGGAPR